VSDESKLQHIRSNRNWRQRYAGPDGDYVYRKNISVRGVDGARTRRVRAGESVDCEQDGISPRRLKALWFSETIELADEAALVPRALKKTIIDNRAIRLEEERVRKEEDAKLEATRVQRRKLNALRIEENAQRTLAERAVRAAEDQERREIEDLIREEERAAREVKIEEILDARTTLEAEEAELTNELASEQAQIEADRAEAARAAQVAVDAALAEEQARLEGETLERIAQREAEQAARQAPPSETPPSKLGNTKWTLSAEQAKAALDGSDEG